MKTRLTEICEGTSLMLGELELVRGSGSQDIADVMEGLLDEAQALVSGHQRKVIRAVVETLARSQEARKLLSRAVALRQRELRREGQI